MPEDMSEYMPEDMSDRMPEDMSEYMPEDMPDRMPDWMPEDMSDRVPEDMPDRMPEDLPDRMPEDMPEDMPDHMPEDMPDRMPNRMSEDMSDRMPEDLPVRKCINVMVGITRSKVIIFILYIYIIILYCIVLYCITLYYVISRYMILIYVPLCNSWDANPPSPKHLTTGKWLRPAIKYCAQQPSHLLDHATARLGNAHIFPTCLRNNKMTGVGIPQENWRINEIYSCEKYQTNSNYCCGVFQIAICAYQRAVFFLGGGKDGVQPCMRSGSLFPVHLHQC